MSSRSTIPLKTILFLLAIALSLAVRGQDQALIDSLLQITTASTASDVLANTYGELHQAYYRTNSENFKKYLDLELEFAFKSNNQTIQNTAKYHKARYLYQNDQMPEAFEILEAIESAIRKSDPSKLLAKILHSKASIYGFRGEYLKALEAELESLKLNREQEAAPLDIAQSLVNIGHVHGSIENIETSTAYYIQAKEIYQQIGLTRWVILCSSYIGLNEKIVGNFSEAEKIFNDCLSQYEHLGLDDDVSTILSYLGSIEQERSNSIKALDHYNRAANICEKTENIQCLADIYQRLAELHIVNNEFRKTVNYCKKSLPLNKMMDYKEGLGRDYLFLNESYAKLSQFDSAYWYLNKYQVLKDTMFKSEKIATINDIETKYQTEKKEQEILLLKEKEKRSGLIKKGMFAGILGLLGLFCVLFYAMKQRLAKNKLAKEKVDQALTFKNKELLFNKKELDLKKQELTAYALQLAQKNEVLEEIKINVVEARDEKNNRSLQKVINKIDFSKNDDESWVGFRNRFLSVHKDFEVNVKNSFPNVSSNEMRIMTLLKMNLSSKEIANILNISGEGIKKARYRLRKKLGLETSDSLEELILKI